MSTNELYALWIVIILIGAVLLGLPVALVMAGLGIVFGTMAFGSAIISYQAALNTFGVMSGWELLAIPLFVFMGALLEKADIAGRLYLGLRLLFGDRLYRILVGMNEYGNGKNNANTARGVLH